MRLILQVFFFFLNVLFHSVFLSEALHAQGKNNTLKSSEDYVRIIKYYRYLKPDSALFYVKEGVAKAEAKNDQLGMAALLNQYGMIEDNATNTEKAREKYMAAEHIYRQHKEEKGLAAVLIRLAGVERKKGNSRKSLPYIMEALKISEKNKHKEGILEARIALAQTYYYLGDTERTINNLRIAEEIDEQVPLSNMSLDMYIHFGAVYNQLRKPDSAIVYIEKGLSKSNKTEYNGLRATLLQGLGVAYSIKGDTKKALLALKQSLNLAIAIKNTPRQQTTLIEISKVYEKEQPDSALVYLQQALVIATQLKKDRQRIVILDKMSDIYRHEGYFEKALMLREESNTLAKSVYYEDMRKQVVSLEAAYDLEKSKAKLRELTIKNTEETNQKNIILSVAIGTFIILLITLVYYLRSRHFNKQLKQVNEALEESNHVKDKFFSIIAHDIRSPLASTIGVLELIDQDELDEETKRDVVKKLIVHSQSSLEILDKLLRWGHMQIKGIIMNPTAFNPLPNIERNVALLKSASDKKEIGIRTNVPNDIVLNADADHFDFVIRNLTANAIKFTGIGGEIVVKVESASKDTVKFSVIDNGVGISEARVKKLFQLASTSTKGTSSEEGTSLGLIICKQFVEANHGKIEVQSELGKGTVFSFIMRGYQKS